MKHAKIYLALILFLPLQAVKSQNDMLTELASKNVMELFYDGDKFVGKGWDFIVGQVEESQHVLIGEDHFSNEIPVFTQAIANVTKFDNFYVEVDPYSTKIIEEAILRLPEAEHSKFKEEYGHLFSFYALAPEYGLLKTLVGRGVKLLGSDQIIMYADGLIFQDLISKTKNTEAKNIYSEITKASEEHLNQFFENPQNPMYFMTPDFSDKLAELKQLELSEEEHLILDDMSTSLAIYQEQSHKKRIRLILRQLMKDYPIWSSSRTLFKYGAMHMARGESFLTVYDVGNMVANITDSNEQKSLHIMIVGEGGIVGSPFEVFPPTAVDAERGVLSDLKPFFDITEGNRWHVFDLLPLRDALNKKKLKIENTNLVRAIKGFDVLITIPELTPAKF